MKASGKWLFSEQVRLASELKTCASLTFPSLKHLIKHSFASIQGRYRRSQRLLGLRFLSRHDLNFRVRQCAPLSCHLNVLVFKEVRGSEDEGTFGRKPDKVVSRANSSIVLLQRKVSAVLRFQLCDKIHRLVLSFLSLVKIFSFLPLVPLQFFDIVMVNSSQIV